MTEEAVLRLSYAPHAGHAPAFLARAVGHFEQEGLTVRIEPGKGSLHTVEAVGAGEADFGTVDAFGAMGGWLRGAPIVSLFVELQASLLGLVVWEKRSGAEGAPAPRPARPALSAERGFRLGIIPGSTVEVAARAVVGHLNLEGDGVRFLPVRPGEEPAALARGEIDGTVTAVTNEVVMWRRRPELRLWVWSLEEIGIDVYGHVLVAGQEVMARRPALADRFVRAMRRGWEEALAAPARAVAALVEAVPGLDPDLEEAKFRAVADLTHRGASAQGHQDPGTWERLAGLLVRYGRFPSRGDLRGFMAPLQETSADRTRRA